MDFPSFRGSLEEKADDFCDDIGLACIVSRQNEEGMLKMFPFALKA